MLEFLQEQSNWPAIEKELEQRNVKAMTFYDVVLDFIILDAFKDLDSPPASVLAVVNNRFLSNGFKETVTFYFWRSFSIYDYLLQLSSLKNIAGTYNSCMVSVESKTTYVKIFEWIYGTFLCNIRTNFPVDGLGIFRTR